MMTGEMGRAFVFVVCGSKEHVETLHVSIKFLRKYSKHKILVITDLSRNEIPLQHDEVINVRTPEVFDNHQASIFLKTAIHRFLPKGFDYCYLDTDVIALSSEVDGIFDQFITPIRFAQDHCVLDGFSPYAVNCGCLKSKLSHREKLARALERYAVKDPVSVEKKRQLEVHFRELRSNVPKRILTAAKYVLSGSEFRLSPEFRFDKRNRVWKDSSDNPIIYEADTSLVEKETGLRYDKWKRTWVDESGQSVWTDECDHLSQAISRDLGIKVGNRKWQHWNGGVFLFNDQSHGFLDAWHAKTMDIFNTSYWKTRDQGTLIATVWELGLQDHLPLSKKWNFIADYYNPKLVFDSETSVLSDDEFKTSHEVAFIHVYHHFGDSQWDLWNWIMSKR